MIEWIVNKRPKVFDRIHISMLTVFRDMEEVKRDFKIYTDVITKLTMKTIMYPRKSISRKIILEELEYGFHD